MKLDEIKDLLLFNEWANKKFIEAIQNISEEKYSLEIKSSFSSIKKTISHIVSSEWIWLQRLNGNNPTAPPDWSTGATLEILKEKISNVESGRREFLTSLKDEDLNKPLIYNLLSGKTYNNTFKEILQHIVNHSSYHRGQLATLFRQVDEVPPNTDLINFYRQRS